jgi:multidrug efflux pump subunit AcrA (membrane-fusion protein)
MRRVKILLLAVALPLALLGVAGSMIAVKARGRGKPLRTATVERGDVVVAVRETGAVEPIKRVEVKSKVAGQLAQLAVEEGDRVQKGQLIARLTVPEVEAQRDQVRAQLEAARARVLQAQLTLQQNPALIASQIDQTKAGLRSAEASLREAQARRKDAERVHESKRQLFQMGGYVAQNDVDSAKMATEVAAQQEASAAERVSEQKAALVAAQARQAEVAMNRARVAEAEASVRQIQDSLAETESRLADAVIRAPCSGVIISRQVREGEVITATSYYGSGAPLVVIGDVTTMLAKVNLNEVDIDKVHLGQQVQIKADALTGRNFTGTLTRISPASAGAASQATGAGGGSDENIVRFPVEITVSGDHGDLKPGMTANVEILCKSARGVLWVPNDSVFQKNGKSCVSVVTGQPEGKGKGKPGPGTTGAARLWGRAAKPKTEERLVTVGLVNDIRTEVRSGVKLGEKVELGKSGIPERKKINIHSGPDGGE